MAVIAAFAFIVAGCTSATPPAASSSPAGSGAAAKPLSRTDVAIHANFSIFALPGYIADKEGYFKKNGLNVKLDTKLFASPTDGTTTMLSGAFPVQPISTNLIMSAVSAGAPFKAIMAATTGSNDALMFPAKKLEALGIAVTATTPEATLKQFQALKGSHVKLAVPPATTGTYASLLTVCKTYGLTCAPDSPTSDINMMILGTTPLINVAVNTGQADGAAQTPGQSTITGPVGLINTGTIKPLSETTNTIWTTTASMVKDHPDTVQAIVTSLVEAWDFIRKNPAAARKYFDDMNADNGVTNPAALAAQFTGGVPILGSPVLNPKGFQLALDRLNLTVPTPLKLTFSDLNEDSFVKNAIAQLKLTNIPE